MLSLRGLMYRGAAGTLASAVCATCLAGPAYHLEEVGTLGGTYSIATAINSRGDVAGVANLYGTDAYHAFVYSNGKVMDLGGLGGNSMAWAINDRGQVAGSSYKLPGASEADLRAFLYTNGTMEDLGTLGGRYSQGLGLNNRGDVTGGSWTRGDDQHLPFIYSRGEMKALGSLGGDIAEGWGINNAGDVTGESRLAGTLYHHAFLYADGEMRDLGTLGGISSRGMAVNSSRQVTGQSTLGNGHSQHAFLFSDGVMHDLGTLEGDSESFAFALNDRAHVVGWSQALGSFEQKAFLYRDGQMWDLLELVDSSGAGWHLSQARGINSRGQIAGFGVREGQTRAFLLTPVPEPSTYALMLIGLAIFAWKVSRPGTKRASSTG
jgi:probable HAF family extracellular repeat protein